MPFFLVEGGRERNRGADELSPAARNAGPACLDQGALTLACHWSERRVRNDAHGGDPERRRLSRGISEKGGR